LKASEGQFVSQDPVFWEVGQSRDGLRILRDPQLANSYSYAGGNPITQKDPSGRIVPLLLAAASVLSIAVDVYDYVITNTNFNVNQFPLLSNYDYQVGYKDQFTQAEKDESKGRLILDGLTFGAGFGYADKSTQVALNVLPYGLDVPTSRLPSRTRPSNTTAPSQTNTFNYQARSSRDNGERKYQTTSGRQSITSKNRTTTSTNSKNVSVSSSLQSASAALNSGDYSSAVRYLKNASVTLKK
jgi:hypothetical protein